MLLESHFFIVAQETILLIFNPYTNPEGYFLKKGRKQKQMDNIVSKSRNSLKNAQ